MLWLCFDDDINLGTLEIMLEFFFGWIQLVLRSIDFIYCFQCCNSLLVFELLYTYCTWLYHSKFISQIPIEKPI